VAPHSKRKKKAKWILIMSGLLGASILSATAGALLALSLSSTPLLQSSLTPEEAAIFEQNGNLIDPGFRLSLPRLTRPVNILLLGTKVLTTDVNDPPPETQNLGYQALVNSFDGLSDTMLLIRFDPVQGHVTVLSIPRDTRVPIDGVGLTKINAANAVGGPALTAKTVSELLNGAAIDRYVRVNVQGVEKLIDALGGVKIYVPKDMHYQDDSQHLYIDLKAGEQRLNGDQSLQFLRFRYDAYGDIGRIQRQQMFMRSLTEQALNPTTITRLPRILSVIRENLDTNLTVDELLALVGFASQVDRSQVQMLMLPGDFSSPQEYDASYWLPDYNRIDAMAAQHFDRGATSLNSDPQPASVRIAIEDSTGQGVESLTNQLYNAGYGDVYVDNDWAEPLQVTRIIAQGGDRQMAEDVQRALGVGEVRIDSTGSLNSDITIQVGQDWLEQAGSLN
jgi:LCP family protein required for cell wall assembly